MADRQIRQRDSRYQITERLRPSRDVSDSMSREKFLAITVCGPYRERTHVVKESILR